MDMNPGRESDRRAANPAEADALNPFSRQLKDGVTGAGGKGAYRPATMPSDASWPGHVLICVGRDCPLRPRVRFIVLYFRGIGTICKGHGQLTSATLLKYVVLLGIPSIIMLVPWTNRRPGRPRGMKELRVTGLSMAAGPIIAIVPFSYPCCSAWTFVFWVPGVPFGIWPWWCSVMRT